MTDHGPELTTAVDTVVRRCLSVQPGEQVLVICDGPKRDLGDALRDGAAAAGADAVLMVMDPREIDGNEPPASVAAAFGACDAFLAPTARSLSHTKARKAATDRGARGATLPSATADILGRLMSCDLETLQRRSRALAELLTEADEAHFTCPLGSDFRLDLSGRRGISDDGDLSAPGSFGNLPCGEGFIAPLHGEGHFFSSSLASIGLAGEPVRLTVIDGALADATGPEGSRLIERLRGAGPLGTNLAELGIGTNEMAGLTGNVLEDEKILGSLHVAFGASAGIGGTVSVPVHLDSVVLDPTLDVGGTRVLDGGRFVFEA